MAEIVSIRLVGADAALFERAKAQFGLSRMANTPSLLFMLEKAMTAVPTAPVPKLTKEDTTRSREELWSAIIPALNSPQLNEYWEERKYALFSHMSPREAVEGESLNSKEKRLHKGERFYQDYIAWQEGDTTLCEVEFNPATDQKILCNAS
jgi:hypothetical protein